MKTRPGSFMMLLALCNALFYTAAPAFAASGAGIPCNIQLGSCMTRTPEGIVIRFDVEPKPVTSMAELTFMAHLSRYDRPVTNAEVEVDLTMPGMFMGTTRPKLNHMEKGRYEGKSMLMRCASGRKTWQADVTIVEGAQRTSAAFVFEVQ